MKRPPTLAATTSAPLAAPDGGWPVPRGGPSGLAPWFHASRLLCALAAAAALPAFAQSFYRCQEGDNVLYADHPCVVGIETRIPASLFAKASSGSARLPARTLYRCQEGSRVTYSGVSCTSGSEMKIVALLFGKTAEKPPEPARTLYRCEEGRQVTYSGQPCASGTETRARADGGPSQEAQQQALARLAREISELDARRKLALQANRPPVAGEEEFDEE